MTTIIVRPAFAGLEDIGGAQGERFGDPCQGGGGGLGMGGGGDESFAWVNFIDTEDR